MFEERAEGGACTLLEMFILHVKSTIYNLNLLWKSYTVKNDIKLVFFKKIFTGSRILGHLS